MAVGTAGLIVSSLISGISGYLQTAAKNKAARAQAQQLLNNAEVLQQEIARGEVNLQQALGRIDTMISTAKGDIRNVMEKQVNLATRDIEKQYREGLKTAMDQIQQELGQRRLLGSGYGQETRAKTAKGMAKQAGEQTADIREKAANAIAEQMAKLELQGGLLKESKREGFEQFRTGALGEVLQLQTMAKSLKTGQASPWLAAFAGTAPGIGQIAEQFFTPSEEYRETGTGSKALPSTTAEGTTIFK